ncbi:MAG TPA: carboxypeptidase-like regulatory domain-containing protein [Bacteroidales bacterium]|nr:carboxypeptidase-like regulatory domain-containing protein [Bacteroidales bacterium]
MGLSYYLKTNKGQNRNRFFPHCHHIFSEARFLGAGFLLFFVVAGYGQTPLLDQRISIPRQHTSLYEALNLVSEKAGCFFIYNSETVENDKSVRLHADNQPLHEVLDNLLSDPRLAYKVMGKHILIYRNDQKTPPSESTEQVNIPVSGSPRDVVIRGHIRDKDGKTAIPFATVGIVEENIGTVTNSDGYFVLRVPASLAGTSLVVSHLGYISQRIPVGLLDEQQVDLCLERRVISIQEVIIRYLDPVSILANAMDRRKENFATDPAYLTTFYREGVEKNGRYISYSEAVFKVYKAPVTSGEHSDQVKLLKSRKIRKEDPGDTVLLKLKAGVQSALELDIVKCIPGFLDLRPPVDYTYFYSNLIPTDHHDAYAITFTQHAGLDEALYTGTIYIDKENDAILGADFEINPDHIEKAAVDFILKKSPNVNIQLEKITYSVSYAPFNGRYYLNHVRCDIQLKTRLRHHLSADHFSTFLELATCNIDTSEVVKFPKQELMKPDVVFSDESYTSDDAFWGSYNFIAPETRLKEALSKIIGQIEKIE